MQTGIAAHIHGLQHVGLPVRDLDEAVRFYEQFGMMDIYHTVNDGQRVCFLQQGSLVIECYEEPVVGKTGAINHIAFDVDDVEELHRYCESIGAEFDDDEIHFLPFWERGVRYFIIIGPNAERVEFNQKL